MLLVLVACSGGEPDRQRPDDSDPTSGTGDTGTAITTPTGDTGTLPTGCAVDPGNALRAWCTTEVAPTADHRVELVRSDGVGPTRTFLPDPHLGPGVLLWGMEPETSWDWRIVDEGAGVDLAGTFATRALPEELGGARVEVSVTDPSAQIDAFLFSATCPAGVALMADVDGDVIWYQDLHAGTSGGGSINALQWTEDRTVLAHTSRSAVRELDLAGNVRLDLGRGVAFQDYVHHDLYRRDGLTYDLRARQGSVDGDAVVMDGVYVFDAAGGLVDELDAEGLWPYNFLPYMYEGYWGGVFPDAVDFSHANSVVVDPAGDLLVSFRHLSAIAKFQGGPGTPGFGTLLWTAVGDTSSPIVAAQDFTLSGPSDSAFQGQHDVNLLSDGSLVMLDNGFPLGQSTRAVRYALDGDARTLTLLEAWDIGEYCPVLGGVRELPGGDLLVTCDSAATIYEFRAGEADPVWQGQVRCDKVPGNQVARAIPVRLQ